MAKLPNTKRLQIDKANTTIVAVTSVAAFVFIFCAVATKTLISQAAYQNKVIGDKRAAVNQLEANVKATNDLQSYYSAFVGTATNVIGGTSAGGGERDGTNADIVLDALPSSYDFPALVTSLDKMILDQNLKVNSITGTDDEVAQSAQGASADPQAIPMPFEVSVQGSYDSVRGLVNSFERSIRPIQVQTVKISGGADPDSLTMDISAQTFYQPAKSLSITKEVVK